MISIKRPALLFYIALLCCCLFIIVGISRLSSAQEEGFSLQVTPSPLVATVLPGQTSELELKIRNTNTVPETLRMGLRSFSINNESGEVELSESIDPAIEKFVTFSAPVFTLEAGEWYTQKIIVTIPEDSGFSYSFATTITRDAQQTPSEGSSQLEGSVAVFTLLSVDKPGATRSFEVLSFTSDKKVYEYLPATFSLKIKNTGNTIVQPTGTVFIQRTSSDTNPISTLPLNQDGGYVIPSSERTFDVVWMDGFPHFEKSSSENKSALKWDFTQASKFRIGKYTARFVAVYDDGERDIPIIGELSFWVIPWKQILIIILAFILMILGLFFIFRGLLRGIKNKTTKNEKTYTSK